MNIRIEPIIFYILLIDSVGSNLMAWLGDDKWYKRNFRIISRYFPITRGWTTYYLILVIFIGYLLKKSGVL
jgi:hypothetical protein